MSAEVTCRKETLVDFVSEIFTRSGFRPADSRCIAEQLVIADMRGMRSHGVVRVDMYLAQANGGAIDRAGTPEITRETPTTAVIDAHRAAGAVASELAARMAREKALQNGLGMVVVRNSNHHGTCGYWGMKMAGDDVIAFVTSNTPPLMAAPASRGAVIGNNPISVVVPANGRDMCLDISNGVMAFGKIHEYRRLNKPMPENAWLDETGEPTTDPFANDFLKFISLPVGMHKGFGLAVMAEMVSSMLSGGAAAAEILAESTDTNVNNETAHCFLAININSFCDAAEYRERADRFIDYLHSAEKRRETDTIYYPGEIENIAYERSCRTGVTIPETTRDYLCAKAAELGFSVPDDLFTGVKE